MNHDRGDCFGRRHTNQMSWNATGSTFGELSRTAEVQLVTPTPGDLVNAARSGDKPGVFRKVHQGAWIEERDAIGYTALLRVADMGSVEICKFLIKAGANIEAKNIVRAPSAGVGRAGSTTAGPSPPSQHGNTPLMLAATNNHYLVVDALLWAGANTGAKNNVRPLPL